MFDNDDDNDDNDDHNNLSLSPSLSLSMARCGMNNAAVNAQADGHRGYGVAYRNTLIDRYDTVSRKLLANTKAVALHWDGAMYDGWNVNIAFAIDCESLNGCHLQPIVHFT